MSIRKRRLLRLAMVIVAIIIVNFIYWLTRTDVQKKVLSCYNVYSKSMKMGYTAVDHGKKQIELYFKMKHDFGQDDQETIFKTYKAIIHVFLYEQQSQYKDYSINLCFGYQECDLAISNISKSFDSIEFHSSSGMSIKSISELYPFTARLCLFPAYYDDISEISGFTNLQYVFFSQGITYDEEKYILSVFPNCEVDTQGDNS